MLCIQNAPPPTHTHTHFPVPRAVLNLPVRKYFLAKFLCKLSISFIGQNSEFKALIYIYIYISCFYFSECNSVLLRDARDNQHRMYRIWSMFVNIYAHKFLIPVHAAAMCHPSTWFGSLGFHPPILSYPFFLSSLNSSILSSRDARHSITPFMRPPFTPQYSSLSPHPLLYVPHPLATEPTWAALCKRLPSNTFNL